MAFVCTATQPPIASATIVPANGRWDVIAEIGYDTSGDPYTFYLGIHTYPVGIETEFGFCMIAINNKTGVTNHTYRSSVANSIIPKQEREKVAFLLWYYSREIIQSARHRSFFMETFEVGLPVGALEKYRGLIYIFRSLGYDVKSVPAAAGKHKWFMHL